MRDAVASHRRADLTSVTQCQDVTGGPWEVAAGVVGPVFGTEVVTKFVPKGIRLKQATDGVGLISPIRARWRNKGYAAVALQGHERDDVRRLGIP